MKAKRGQVIRGAFMNKDFRQCQGSEVKLFTEEKVFEVEEFAVCGFVVMRQAAFLILM